MPRDLPLDRTDRVNLLIQAGDVAGREALLREVLLRIPGVKSVDPLTQDETSVEARIGVEFDPHVANPITMEETLEREGFTVLSAAEEP